MPGRHAAQLRIGLPEIPGPTVAADSERRDARIPRAAFEAAQPHIGQGNVAVRFRRRHADTSSGDDPLRRLASLPRPLLMTAAIVFALATAACCIWLYYIRILPQNVIRVAFKPFSAERHELDLVWEGETAPPHTPDSRQATGLSRSTAGRCRASISGSGRCCGDSLARRSCSRP